LRTIKSGLYCFNKIAEENGSAPDSQSPMATGAESDRASAERVHVVGGAFFVVFGLIMNKNPEPRQVCADPVKLRGDEKAIQSASNGPVEEGAVGAGTGTIAFGFKGGIGTASRHLPAALGGYTVGVLVQTNFGGILTINGAPVGRELGRYFLKEVLEHRQEQRPAASNQADGSVIVVIATDAPVDARNLHRLAARSMLGLARTGFVAANGSGDYAIAFSTHPELRITMGATAAGPLSPRTVRLLTNEAMSPLFLAVIEATEEAVYNSLFGATTMSGCGHTVEALPLDQTVEILRRYGAINGQSGTVP
jgi:D-aminopeptidase